MEEKKYLTEDERKEIIKKMGPMGRDFDPVELFCPECGERLLSTWCTKCDKVFKYSECVQKQE